LKSLDDFSMHGVVLQARPGARPAPDVSRETFLRKGRPRRRKAGKKARERAGLSGRMASPA
jgi:hypothetical protein